MIAVLKHELKSYFHSLTAYVFGAFLLVITGIGAMMYNIQAAMSNFEYVLSFGSIVFVVIVPILTIILFSFEPILLYWIGSFVYPAYKKGQLNVSELARVCDLCRTMVYKYIDLLEA